MLNALPVRWRLALFNFSVWLNRFVPLVPRRSQFSLLRGQGREEAPSVAAPLLVPSTAGRA